MKYLLCASLFFLNGLAPASRTDYLSAKRKFTNIEKYQVAAGSRVALTSQEINAYVQTELPQVAPPGIREPKVELQGNNVASGRAMVDFVKLRSAQGKPPGWILRNLLQGEHELAVTTRVRSANGTATVDIQRVEIEGIPISGAALDFLIKNYLIPHYPTAKIGQPIPLKYRMERLEVQPGVAYVVMKQP
jgi:hypothetical protein